MSCPLAFATAGLPARSGFMNAFLFLAVCVMIALAAFMVAGFNVVPALVAGAAAGGIVGAIIVENVNGTRKSRGKGAFFT